MDSFGDGNTLVYTYRPQQISSLREQDFVLVRGVVPGQFVGENAFGAELTAPQVEATSVRAISAATAAVKADPPVASKALRVAGEQAGFRVVVRKVERLRSGGRVTVEAINRSGGKVSRSTATPRS